MIESLLIVSLLAAPVEDDTDAMNVAFENFKVLDAGKQLEIVTEVEARLAKATDADYVKLRELWERAKRELPLKPATGPRFYEHSVYAPIQEPRHFVESGSADANQVWDTMRPWENTSPFLVNHVTYDFAADCGRESPAPAATADRLGDMLLGTMPGADVLAAWMCWRLDTKDDLNPIAEHFAHAYCDRIGNCYSDVTIYDAYASENSMEMSDIEVIAYARNLLKDNSFHSPIAADLKRQKLYERINDDFLRYFRHRTFVEAIAWLSLHPDAEMRQNHEGMRSRVWTLLAKYPSFDAVADAFRGFKDREEFVAKSDAWFKEPKSVAATDAWRATRNGSRWVVHNAAKAVLSGHGLWPGTEATPPAAPAPPTEPASKPTGGGESSDGTKSPAPAASQGDGAPKNDESNDSSPERPEEKHMLNVGDPAPDFSVPDETGKVRTLAEFRGKTVLLWFYPKASTPG